MVTMFAGMYVRPQLEIRELGMIFAGLRVVQALLRMGQLNIEHEDLWDIATAKSAFAPLTPEEIEDLLVRLHASQFPPT